MKLFTTLSIISLAIMACSRPTYQEKERAVEYGSATYDFISSEMGWMAVHNDSIRVLRHRDVPRECFQVFPVGVVGSRTFNSSWTVHDDECGIMISNDLVFTVSTSSVDTGRDQEVVYGFYQEVGRSHEKEPCGKRYVFYSSERGIFEMVNLDDCDIWPYVLN